MRTTVELSDPIYRRLRARAAERGVRGFSSLVEEALRQYLEQDDDATAGDPFTAARGAWGAADVRHFEAELRDAWATWPSGRS
ncbi:MAG TPA: ribbon-helix-helix protein, CopG family [Conexibacter sp.]|nr:ribbon-helix-helix protein, CopG family [Conexibacter sp.]